jgi:hypothetical protein
VSNDHGAFVARETRVLSHHQHTLTVDGNNIEYVCSHYMSDQRYDKHEKQGVQIEVHEAHAGDLLH